MPKAGKDFFNCDIACMAERANPAWDAAPPSTGLSSQDGAVIIARAVRSSRADFVSQMEIERSLGCTWAFIPSELIWEAPTCASPRSIPTANCWRSRSEEHTSELQSPMY